MSAVTKESEKLSIWILIWEMKTETVQHFICCCKALARQRYDVFGRLTRTKRNKHSLSKGPLPLHMRRRVIEAVLNEKLGLHNKPKAEVHKLTGPKEKKPGLHESGHQVTVVV